MLKPWFKIAVISIAILIAIPLLLVLGLFLGITPKPPSPPSVPLNLFSDMEPIEHENGLLVLEENWLRQNRYGLWEMYIEGDAFNRGVVAGKLSERLVRYQEEVFIAQIHKVIPSKSLQRILLSAIAWMNRKMPEQVLEEFKKEIYGISLSASEDFNTYGPAFARMLNYHGAHDIGHAMQSYYLVGCSSFAAWNNRTSDSSLLIGRNFDFYFGDDFSRHKIIEFVKPEIGYNFAYITWGGMAGVVSGMNDKGLTITINAGTLKIGRRAATPVTLVAREILQFAKTIHEADSIANSRKINVSETFMIGSAIDNKATLIEKKPEEQYTYTSDSSILLCTNHFQSEKLAIQVDNIENRDNNATGYRFHRLQELVNMEQELKPGSVASILRDKDGLGNTRIGYGNEKALNQFIAHHAVIFEPAKKILWISTAPNVMGNYLAYNLDSIFASAGPPEVNRSVDQVELEIQADTFLHTQSYLNFLEYKRLSDSIRTQIDSENEVDEITIDKLIVANPEYFEAYMLAGDYYFSRKNYEKALINYKLALHKETNSKSVSDYIEEQITHCK